jgi:uracil-DNA glycosylase family 4
MSADPPKKTARRQVKQHLDALHAAGVEHVPAAGPKPKNAIPPVGRGGRSPEHPGTSAPAPLGSPISIPSSSSLFDVSTDVPESADDRRHALQLMAADVAKCDRCPELFATRTQTVFGIGPVGPDICFVGEAPGADEDRTGIPFVGRAGQLLDKIIAAMGISRDEVYICNTLKCRPPQNRTPTPVECANCKGYFERQIELVKPKYIVCLGAVAAQNVLGSKLGINKLRGTFHQYKGVPVVCTLHPAYLLRDPSKKKDCWEDMKMLLTRMGRPIPKPNK